MNKDERVQVRLVANDSHLTCWVDQKVKVGNFITLKNSETPSQMWEVVSVSEPKNVSQINSNRDYRVGGL